MLPPTTKEFTEYPSTLGAENGNPNLLPRFLITADITLPVVYFIPKGGTWSDDISKGKKHNYGTLHRDVKDLPQETQTLKTLLGNGGDFKGK